ncbi:MAG: LysM domain-containing protein [Bacillota bacterium]
MHHYHRCPAGTFPYVIRSGDTFWLLAQRYNTTVEAIQAANPGADPLNLQIGQVVCIPGYPYHYPPPYPPHPPMPPKWPACPPDCMAYTVMAGETIYDICRRRRITVDMVVYYNPGIDCYNLKAGQVICLPN